MFSNEVAELIRGSPTNDSDFVRLRRRFYEAQQPWLEFDLDQELGIQVLLKYGKLKRGGISLSTLESALGWGNRAVTGSNVNFSKLAMALSDINGWDLLLLDQLSTEEAARLSEAAHARGFRMVTVPDPVTIIPMFPDSEGYTRSRSRKTNAEIRRSYRRIGAQNLEFRPDIDWSDIVTLLDRRILPSSEDEDYSRQATFRSFFDEWRKHLISNGTLQEMGLFQGNRLVSFVSGFWLERVFHAFQTAYDPEFIRFRPGILTMDRLIKEVYSRKCNLFSFMGSGRTYFDEFTKLQAPLVRAIVFNKSTRGRIARIAWDSRKLFSRSGRQRHATSSRTWS